jgi:hypothetical protein
MRKRRTGRSTVSALGIENLARTPRAAVVALMVVVAAGLFGSARAARGQATADDAIFNEVRRAEAVWDRRVGPERQVVDMVCLVPDTATFLEAISLWDEGHYFPILIDDVECSFKFLRAFHPTRVVRFKRASALSDSAAPSTPDAHWDRAVAAVGRAWSGARAAAALRGDAVPKSLGLTPPGVVVAAPDSPSLAGAVALAAGRFQPLLRWETKKRFADDLTTDEAGALAHELEGVVAARIPDHDTLGDGCDFVTLAGDYPYRYLVDRQPSALDDLVLRSADGQRRWAYAGRLMGGPVASVYRAMCSLFLTPATAVTYNTYAETDRPWSDYAMTGATLRLDRLLPTLHVHGPRANLAGWHQNFDPVNRQGLALINTHGGPTTFHLPAGPGGHTSDVPESLPTAVLIIHSFSAESPDDPETLAGRWLANGAFVYFGAINEPFLQAFRTPSLVSAFLADNAPVVVAVRKISTELYAQPWRLVYFGDPLWRIRKAGPDRPRLATWEPVAAWPAYGAFLQPRADEPEGRRLTWALKTAIFGLQARSEESGPGGASRPILKESSASPARSIRPVAFPFQSGDAARQDGDVASVLLGIDRDRLEARLQTVYDELLVDTLLASRRSAELLDRLTRIPSAARSRDVRRHLETAQTAALQRATAANDFRQAVAIWNDVVRASGSRDFVRVVTERVETVADSPVKLADWRDRLRAAQHAAVEPANAPVIADALKRVESRLGQPRGG